MPTTELIEVYFRAIPIDGEFTFKGNRYVKTAEEAAKPLDSDDVLFEVHYGCVVGDSEFLLWGLNQDDKREQTMTPAYWKQLATNRGALLSAKDEQIAELQTNLHEEQTKYKPDYGTEAQQDVINEQAKTIKELQEQLRRVIYRAHDTLATCERGSIRWRDVTKELGEMLNNEGNCLENHQEDKESDI